VQADLAKFCWNLPGKGRAKGIIMQSGLISKDEEQEKRRNNRSSKKKMAGQTKKTNRVVVPTWKY